MIYEDYRPHKFGDVIGQGDVIPVLLAQSRQDRFSHSYLFFGQSGTGKTTTARITAMAMNCNHVHEGEPCGECSDCKAIAVGKHWDIIEIDGGRFGRIDGIRDLCYKAHFSPIGKRKVYIIDECQQLSNEAWGGLLKLLEEPPPHLSIILCTTDSLDNGKVPETITSRCELYHFKKLKSKDMVGKLKSIAEEKSVTINDDWLKWVVEFSEGNERIAECELGKRLCLEGV